MPQGGPCLSGMGTWCLALTFWVHACMHVDLGEEETTALTSVEEARAQSILSNYNWSSGFINTLTTQLEGELDATEAVG